MNKELKLEDYIIVKSKTNPLDKSGTNKFLNIFEYAIEAVLETPEKIKFKNNKDNTTYEIEFTIRTSKDDYEGNVYHSHKTKK